MEPTFYLRVLRLRWRILALCVVLGAGLGYASTALEDDTAEPRVTSWVATHKLIVNPEATVAGRFPNLLQTALLVTGGEVPDTVAARLGGDADELTSRIRTVADLEVSVIEISGAAQGLDAAAARAEAAQLADAYANAMLELLGARELAAYNGELDAARSEVEVQGARLVELEDEVDDLQVQLDALDRVDLDADPDNDADPAERRELDEALRTARIERDSRATLYRQAIDALDALERQGEPVPLMETLDVVPPFAIGDGAYSDRIAQGIAGNNNFTPRTVPSGGGGGISITTTVSNPVVRAMLGATAGLLLAIGGVLLHLRLDPRLRTKAEVEEAFDLPVIAEIPRFDRSDGDRVELHAFSRSRSGVTEAYRMVRSALLFARSVPRTDPFTPSVEADANGSVPGPARRSAPGFPVEPADEYRPPPVAAGAEGDVRVVMVTSPGPSEGKTTTTANLAVVLAEAGYDVLVVNCDYRIPKLHRYFGRPHEPRRAIATGIPGVTLVAEVADPDNTNPTAVVEAQRALIEKARRRYDVVLLDTAPLLATNDAVSLLPVVDLVVVVAQEGRTDREAAGEAVDILRRRQANVAGVVLTGSSGFGRSRYYYKYRYGSYYDADGNSSALLDRRRDQIESDPEPRRAREWAEANAGR